ncbi:MAG: hypothetical protein R8G66_34985 [Cytophagales bacterium]|nr:hypothetical protein [Cytophagales bacterium]
MKKINYDKRISSLLDKINGLAQELLTRPDRESPTVIDRYLMKMNKMRASITDLKIKKLQGDSHTF